MSITGDLLPRAPRPPAPQPQPLGVGLQVAPGPRDAKGPPRKAPLGGARTCTPHSRLCFCPSLLPVHPRGDGTAPRCPRARSRCPCLSHRPVIGLPSSGTGSCPPTSQCTGALPHSPLPTALAPHPSPRWPWCPVPPAVQQWQLQGSWATCCPQCTGALALAQSSSGLFK